MRNARFPNARSQTEQQLWRRIQNQVENNCIRFEKINLGSVDEKAYTLFCCAKDLYLGTKHITIADLADEQLISPKMFGILCNALAIRRFGIGVLNQNRRRIYVRTIHKYLFINNQKNASETLR